MSAAILLFVSSGSNWRTLWVTDDRDRIKRPQGDKPGLNQDKGCGRSVDDPQQLITIAMPTSGVLTRIGRQ
jgi:hypothetical protein